ncbi:HXXXD-type acyl-transferase family protein [Abeliophyllum distichum]|uniref:HXXXD-type acyl-transferase family protein n=1 Tax=Abeliophyllum distichum TaxID=126358 RepID=A0ABD1UNJ1_9LAMI
MSNFVHVKEAVLITPAEPTPAHNLQLSALDSQLFVRFTFEYLLVYKPSHGLDKFSVIENVKACLRRVLVPYYPLAGRVRARADGLGLEVVCRAQGAVFLEALSDSTVSELEKCPRNCAQWRKLLSFQVADVLKGSPPLVVQLTWLSDGGATLAVGFNHSLCDGIGSGEFLNSFSELATGRRGLGQLKPKPAWSRHLLCPTVFGTAQSNILSHPEFGIVPDLCGFASRYIQETLVPTSVTFDKRKLSELKKLAAFTSELNEFPCTSFEVLSAHVWRSWARALNLPPNQILKLVFSVNIRKRVKPSLPTGYYGNAFVLGCAQTFARDLTERGLGYATELVKRAKERVDDEYVREVVESVSSSRASVDSVGVMILTQWSRLGLENVDFGMGKPVQVEPVCCDKYCILLPDADQTDAVKVNVAVPTGCVDQYLHYLRSTCTS